MQHHRFISVDLKITDFCSYGCAFCYQNSTKFGKHAKLDFVLKILDFLKEKEIFEIVIGGGEPTSHPNILEIIFEAILRGFSVSITTKNPKFKKLFHTSKARKLFDYYALKKYQSEFSMLLTEAEEPILGTRYINLVNFGFSISANKTLQLEELKTIKKEIENRRENPIFKEDTNFRLILQKKIVPVERIKLHLIEGIHFKTIDDIIYYAKLIKKLDLDDYISGLLLLGFKRSGRGNEVLVPVLDKKEIISELSKRKFYIKNIQVSVDSAFINDVSLLQDLPIDRKSFISEGERTFYIDAVSGTYAKSSYDPRIFELTFSDSIFEILNTEQQ